MPLVGGGAMGTYVTQAIEQPHVEGPAVSLLTSSRTLAVNQDVVDVPDPLTGEKRQLRWTQGVAYLPESLGASRIVDLQDFTNAFNPAGAGQTGGEAIVTFAPFGIEAGFTASALQWESADFRDRALRYLDAITPAWIEHELWTGALTSSNPNLVDATVLPAGATALTTIGTSPKDNAIRALALLEEALTPVHVYTNQGSGTVGDLTAPAAGGPGMIHASRDLVALWSAAHLLQDPVGVPNPLGGVGQKILTKLGNIVVPGVGYPGTPPTTGGGTARSATVAWAYATDPVITFIGEGRLLAEETTGQQFSRSAAQSDVQRDTNTITVRAQRPALFAFDTTRLYAVGVTVG